MADVTGPISTLPGAVRNSPPGMTCDTEGHETRPATYRVQGETDSFGSEQIDMCDECNEKYKAYRERLGGANHIGICPRGCCKDSPEQGLFAYRDYEEGSCGPIYYYCRSCGDAIRARERQELAEQEEGDDYFDSGDN